MAVMMTNTVAEGLQAITIYGAVSKNKQVRRMKRSRWVDFLVMAVGGASGVSSAAEVEGTELTVEKAEADGSETGSTMTLGVKYGLR